MDAVEFPCHGVREMAALRRGATFLTVRNYINRFHEKSDFSICFHVSYLSAVKKAQELVRNYRPTIFDTIKKPFTILDLNQAKEEMLASYEWTLKGYNPWDTSSHAYEQISFLDDVVPGIKLHQKQDAIHLWGFLLRKRIITPGVYPADRRKPKTIAKHAIRQMTPLGRFRQFKLVPKRFGWIAVEGITLGEQDMIRESFTKLTRKDYELTPE